MDGSLNRNSLKNYNLDYYMSKSRIINTKCLNTKFIYLKMSKCYFFDFKDISINLRFPKINKVITGQSIII